MRNPGSSERGQWPWSATWPLLVLTLVSVFNYLDRSLLGLALPAIKRELGSSDTVLGLVSGLAFILFYSLLGIPIAWLADRANRRNIIAAGLTFWSLMTACTGFIGSIWQLAVVRLLKCGPWHKGGWDPIPEPKGEAHERCAHTTEYRADRTPDAPRREVPAVRSGSETRV